ncbi:MAG: hypothetical protein J6A01_00815 [Proteobacteria bacterium]|nr:hypothetical protein [Pseudomonadota bacterium]
MKHTIWIAAFLIMMAMANASAAQEAQQPKKPDLSNPDAISMPPMDPYSLSYVPEMPDGARNIKNQAECAETGGVWSVEYNKSKAGDQSLDFVGCMLDSKHVGRWFFVNCANCKKAPDWNDDIAYGYVWYIDDAVEGWSVMLNAPNDFVRDLWHSHNNQYDGTNFHWDEMGALKMVVSYRNGKRHGRYESYERCIPKQIGQYEDGDRVGTWEYFCPKGSLIMRRYYDRKARPEDVPEGTKGTTIWAERFEEGKKKNEGYMAIEPTGKKNEEEYYYVGNVQYYTPAGNPWFTIHYNANGDLDDPQMIEWCHNEDHPVQQKNLEISTFTKGSELCLGCYDEQPPASTLIKKLCFYGTGELWKVMPIRGKQIHGMVNEFHPTGELLASYRVKNEVPDGVVEYVNRAGVPLGPASNIRDGSGHYKSWWHNGNPHEEGDYLLGNKDGDWRIWYEKGGLEWERHYSAGRLNGEERQWYDNGVLSAVTPYRDGYKDGVKTWYYADGRKSGWNRYLEKIHRAYHNYTHAGYDNIHIEWEKESGRGIKSVYYEDGKLQAEGPVFSGEEKAENDGLWMFYLKNGTQWYSAEYSKDYVNTPEGSECRRVGGTYLIDAENREVGCSVCMVNRKHPSNHINIREGVWSWYRETGKLEKRGAIHMGHLDGKWVYYYSNGSLMLSGSYKIDRKIGSWSGFYENNNPKFTGSYKDGKEDGLWKTYHQGTQKVSSEGVFEDGKRKGKWVWYYPDGSIREEGAFDAGQENGTWTSYYETGQKQGQGEYHNGLREGDWIWWRKDGSEWRKAQFKNGKELQNKAMTGE